VQDDAALRLSCVAIHAARIPSPLEGEGRVSGRAQQRAAITRDGRRGAAGVPPHPTPTRPSLREDQVCATLSLKGRGAVEREVEHHA